MSRVNFVPGRLTLVACAALLLLVAAPASQAQTKSGKAAETVVSPSDAPQSDKHETPASNATGSEVDLSMLFVFMLATFIGIGVIRRVSRLLHTPLMSLTNAISAISVVGSIIVAGGTHYSVGIRILGAIALFASMTNIISGFLITDRMLKMFKTRQEVKA
jgi:H+-translocating NAD(P) transhydrogenase subunit alpha